MFEALEQVAQKREAALRDELNDTEKTITEV
jgi:hypothetical protein